VYYNVSTVSSSGTFKTRFHYAIWFEAGRRHVRSQIPLRYLVRSWSEPASNQLA